MADQKLTDRPSLTSLSLLDKFHVVDVTDLTDSAAGTSKEMEGTRFGDVLLTKSTSQTISSDKEYDRTNTQINTLGGSSLTNVDWVIEQTWVDAKQFGLIGDGVTDDQTAMDNLLNSSANFIKFPKGVYVAQFNNRTSDRTFLFEEGAIIDGTAHIAIGSGGDAGGGAVVTVDNVTVLGTLAVTVRVGSYHCNNINIDKIRVMPVSGSYINQVLNGGSAGIHFYYGSKNMNVGDIIVESTNSGSYALGIDVDVTVDLPHKPENIRIDRIIINNNTEVGVFLDNCIKIWIGEIICNSYNGGVTAGIVINDSVGVRYDRVFLYGTTTTDTMDGIYVLGTSTAQFGYVYVDNSTQIGFRVGAGSSVIADTVIVDTATLECARFDDSAEIRTATFSNSGKGINIQASGNRVSIDKITAFSNTTDNILVNSASVKIRDIVTHDATTSAGLHLTAAAIDFTNDYLETYNNPQGFRCLSAGAVDMGIMNIHDNTNGIIGAGMDDFSYKVVRYNTNTTDTNTNLETLTNFKGKLTARDIKGLSTYADDTAAGVGGLVKDDLYITVTGEVRIKL